MQLITRNEGKPAHRMARAAMAIARMTAPAVIMTLLVPQAIAQEVAPQGGPVLSGQPRYTVEMIIFAYRGADSGNEIFVPDKPRLVPDPDELTGSELEENTYADVAPEFPADQAGIGGEDTIPGEDTRASQRELIELQLLEPHEYTMDDVYRTLQRLDAYEPIMRAAWTQTTPAKETSPAVHLRALGDPPQGLDGSVTLYLGRYLHMIVDLALNADSDGREMTATDRLVAYGDEAVRYDNGAEHDGMLRMPVRYRIAEDRIMKTGETRYFDHPRFGVIVKVTKPRDDSAQEAVSRIID